MALRVDSKKALVGKIALVVVVVAVLGMLGLLMWNERKLDENRPEREPLVYVGETEEDIDRGAEELDEEPIEEDAKLAYKVASDKPRFLTIDKIGVDRARVLEVGVLASGALGTPKNIYDTARYTESGLPGRGGSMLIVGHNGGSNYVGVFDQLGDLVNGDEIIIERGDGAIFRYKVAESKIMTVEEADAYMGTMMTSAEAGKEGLNLISCIGDWNQNQRMFNKRIMIRAVLAY